MSEKTLRDIRDAMHIFAHQRKTSFDIDYIEVATSIMHDWWKTIDAHLASEVKVAEVFEDAYKRGFIAACRWPEPVSQDVDSRAFGNEMRSALVAALGGES